MPLSKNKDRCFEQLSNSENIVEDKHGASEQTYESYPATSGRGYKIISLDTGAQVVRDKDKEEWFNIKVNEQSTYNLPKQLQHEREAKIETSNVKSGSHAVQTARVNAGENQNFPNRSSNVEKVSEGITTREQEQVQTDKICSLESEKDTLKGHEDELREQLRVKLGKIAGDRAESVSEESSFTEHRDQRNITLQDRWRLLDGNESAVRGIPRDNLRWRIGDGCSNVFHPEENKICAKMEYFFFMWFPRLFELLVIYTDFLLMCFLHSSAARTMQGCFLFFPYVVLWGSQYNTSQFEAWYIRALSKEKVDMSIKTWLNTLPWTGVPTVFLQESYILMYMVYIFPIKFWRHQSRIEPRPFQLSRDIYDKSRLWYTRMLRLVFEDLPTVILLFFVLKWSQDNVSVVAFSLFTSIVSVLWTLTVLLTTATNRDQSILMVIFVALLIPPNFAMLPKHYGMTPRRIVR